MNKEAIGTLLAFVAAIVSGVAIFANKFFVVGLDPTVFTAVRAILIGAVFLFLSLYFNSWKAKENRKIKWGILLFIGIIGGGIAFLFFFYGLQLTTSGRAAFLHKTLPLYVSILAFLFLREKITKGQVIALFVMFVGLIMLVSSQISPKDLWTNPALGDWLVIVATFLWAVENIAARKAMIDGAHNFVVSFARMFFGGVFLFGVVLLTGKFNSILALSLVQWFYLVCSAALLFAYVLAFYWSIRYINVSKATSILLVAPVITLILGAAVFGEPTPAVQLIGSMLILIGAYFVASVRSEFFRI